MNRNSKLILILLFAAISAATFASGIKWQNDLRAALKLAKKTNRPLMIDFYGEH